MRSQWDLVIEAVTLRLLWQGGVLWRMRSGRTAESEFSPHYSAITGSLDEQIVWMGRKKVRIISERP